MANILVVDDEIGIRELLSEILGDEGHTIWLAQNASEARALRKQEPVDLVLLDIWMPDTDGVTLLKEWASQGQLTMPVIMMSGHATIDTAVEATRIGALDFLEKPIALQKLLKSVEQGLSRGKAPQMKMLPPTPRPLSAPPLGPHEPLPAALTTASNGQHAATLPGFTASYIAQAQEELTSALVVPTQTPRASITLELPLRDARDEFERIYFEYHLAQENGSMTRVAEKTGLERTHLYRKLKQLGVDLSKSKSRQ
ncbi:MAG: sigma-54-dependent Fis family transcriptional regulator [Burkholderiaceae bacterium]|nr:MAG: sigma-54-dependent Fis family transcriptional regulator [Burkholderiaceae bacterium]